MITKLLKPAAVLNKIDPNDPNVFCTNFLERYANGLNELENTTYADFTTNYRLISADRNTEPDDLESCVEFIANIEITTDSHQVCF